MKLLNFSFTKPRYWVFGLAAAAGTTAAQAQYTGIGTTTPGATLHVEPSTPTDEVLKVTGLKDLPSTDVDSVAAYNEVLVLNNATGLFRRESIEDLLDENGEWIVLDEGTATERIVPRRYQSAMSVDGSLVDIDVAADLASTLDIGSVAPMIDAGNGINDLTDDDRILIQDGTGTRVRSVTVEELVENAGFWKYTDNTETAIQPRDVAIEDEMTINDGTVAIGNAATVGATLNVVGAADFDATVNVDGAIDLQTVTNAAPPVAADRILIQKDDAAAVNGFTPTVQHVTVAELLQENGEWRVDDEANPTYIYAFRARANGTGTDVTIEEATGNVGIGTTAATDKLQIVGGGIDLDADRGMSFGAIGAIGGDGTNVDLTSTGSVDIASTGVTTIQSNGGTIVTVNNQGVGIGVVAVAGRVLQTDTRDGLQFGNLEKVDNVEVQGVAYDATANPGDYYDRILITDSTGVVRYINADALIADAGEWVYQDVTNDGFTADDRVYVRRLRETADATDEVYVDGVGNMVVDASKAYQFGTAANRITAVSLDATADYTMNFGASLTVNSNDGSNVSFIEGANQPWLHFAAADNGNDLGRVGIGTATPLASLHVVGNIVASHTAQTSDERFKREINDLQGALDAVEAMRGVSYEFRGDEYPTEGFDDATHIGFIAQELQEVLPQAVFAREDGYLTVDYAAVTPVLVEAVQELSERIESLEAENAALRSGTTDHAVGAVSTKQLQDLEARLAEMDARIEAATTGRK